MDDEESSGPWSRPLWHPGGGDPFLSFAVFGELEAQAASAVAPRLPGLTPRLMSHDSVVELTANLRPARQDDEAFERAMDSPTCLWLFGEVRDPPTLEYLRPLIETVSELLESGAIGVVDLNAFVFQPLSEWLCKTEGGHIQPFNFVATYWWTDEDGSGQWWRTRGMRTFGRPDISLRHVPISLDSERVRGVIRRLALDLALGRVLASGDRAGPLVFEVDDAFDDPMFLNDRAEATWPT